jgi:hypothetical protein
MGGHFTIMLSRYRIGRAFGALLEHVGLLPEYRRV